MCFFNFILQSNCSCLSGFENYTSDAGCALIDLCKNSGGCDMNANCTMEGPGVKRLVTVIRFLFWAFCVKKNRWHTKFIHVHVYWSYILELVLHVFFIFLFLFLHLTIWMYTIVENEHSKVSKGKWKGQSHLVLLVGY